MNLDLTKNSLTLMSHLLNRPLNIDLKMAVKQANFIFGLVAVYQLSAALRSRNLIIGKYKSEVPNWFITVDKVAMIFAILGSFLSTVDSSRRACWLKAPLLVSCLIKEINEYELESSDQRIVTDARLRAMLLFGLLFNPTTLSMSNHYVSRLLKEID